MSYQPQQQYSAPVAEDPGRTMGIIGLVLAFLAPLIGLIVSIIARGKSKAAGFKNGLATGGIIVSIVMMVLGIIISLAVALPLMAVVSKCGELGPGTHREGGVTYNCG